VEDGATPGASTAATSFQIIYEKPTVCVSTWVLDRCIGAFIHGGRRAEPTPEGRAGGAGVCWSESDGVYVRMGTRRSSRRSSRRSFEEAEGGHFKRKTFGSVYGLREEVHYYCTPKPRGPTPT
jgi:hypothetical protein